MNITRKAESRLMRRWNFDFKSSTKLEKHLYSIEIELTHRKTGEGKKGPLHLKRAGPRKTLVCIGDVLSYMISDKKSAPAEIQRIMSTLKEEKRLSDDINESSFIEYTSVVKMFREIEELGLGDYSLMHHKRVLWTAYEHINGNSQRKHKDEIEQILDQYNQYIGVLASKLEKHAPYVEGTFYFSHNEEKLSQIKRLRTVVDAICLRSQQLEELEKKHEEEESAKRQKQ